MPKLTKQDKLTKLIEIAKSRGFDSIDLDKKLIIPFNHLLFNHDFAKAIWGEENPTFVKITFYKDWKYHLQQAVISEDPLEYYWENK